MKKLFAVVALALGFCFSMSAHAQFNPPSAYKTYNTQCGTYFQVLSTGTYYDWAGNNVGSSLPVCAGSMSIQNGASVLITGGTISGITLSTATYTTSTIPTCNTAAKGQIVTVTDATSPTYNGTYSGSGAVIVPVQCDGTNWKTH